MEPGRLNARRLRPPCVRAIEGGEQISGASVWSNGGAIYNPPANTWTTVPPPAGGTGSWAKIGDAPSVVLPDDQWLLGDSGSDTTDDAILDPSTLTWKTTAAPGKVVGNAEAALTLLPSGKVLSVDVLPPACTTRTAEILDPATLAWSSASTTATPLVNCGDLSEIGPQILMYNGKVFVEGATSATALYDVMSGMWSAGPSFPVVDGLQYNGQDSGAALLPDGNVLVALNSGVFAPPTHFFLFDGTSFAQVPDNSTSSILNNGNTYMLLLPTGQVLYDTGLGPSSMEVFTDSGSPNPADRPTITSVPTTLVAGQTYTLDGDQLNGLSEGAAFGDDYQDSTDYPLVQITDDSSGTVTYARTRFMANRSIAPGAVSCTNFTLPSDIPTGTSELRVISNGIASDPVAVMIGSIGANTTSCVPTLVARPAVSGTPGVGHLLTSSPGTWTNATTYAYRWQLCAPDGGGCANIPNATASTHTLTSADAGSTLRSAVTASNGNSIHDAVTSDPTAVIAPVPAATSLPEVSGTPIIGKTLSTTAGAWNTAVSITYQWLRCSDGRSECTAIGGAASSTYLLSGADAGYRLETRVAATNAAETIAAVSALTPLVVGLPASDGRPHIFGKPRVGKRLRASHGAWTGPPASYGYQWLRCSRKGSKCISIERANRATYRPEKRDAGHRIRVRVAAMNAAGSTRATSRATRIVAGKGHARN